MTAPNLPGTGRSESDLRDDGVVRIARVLCVSLLPDEEPCESCEDAAYRVYVKRHQVAQVLHNLSEQARAERTTR